MTGADEISDAGRRQRFEQWEKLGVDRVKADLLAGGDRIVGGPPQVRDLAWRWVRTKEAAAAAAKPAEVITIKPRFQGVSIDLKEVFRRVRRRWTKR